MRTQLAAVAAVVLISSAPASDCTRTSTGLIPITDLGPGLYLGQFQGGLYPGGVNAPPSQHAAAALGKAANIVPRNGAGVPTPASGGGKVVLLSIGLSNTTQEFCGGSFPACQSFSFIGQSAASQGVNHTSLIIVDGAIGGQTPTNWDSPTDPDYTTVQQRLAAAGVSEAQVQAVWIKEADAQPAVHLPGPSADAYALERGIGDMVRACKARYPNLQIVYLSSRIYAGYASSALNPEPYAYESAFAVKWLIQAQINQKAVGQIDAIAGDLDYDTVAPLLLWGAYLWADGTRPRSDGLTWVCDDFNPSDGTHPATGARTKVGQMLLANLLAAPSAAGWFRNPDPACPFIFVQPQGGSVCGGAGFSFSIDAAGHGGVTYQWRRNAVAIPGATSATLAIPHAAGRDAGQYDCVVTNACGGVTSAAVPLRVCVADVDDGTGTGVCDGGVTIDDLLYYLRVFADGGARADVDDGGGTGTPDGGVTIDDLLYFLARFSAGC